MEDVEQRLQVSSHTPITQSQPYQVAEHRICLQISLKHKLHVLGTRQLWMPMLTSSSTDFWWLKVTAVGLVDEQLDLLRDVDTPHPAFRSGTYSRLFAGQQGACQTEVILVSPYCGCPKLCQVYSLTEDIHDRAAGHRQGR